MKRLLIGLGVLAALVVLAALIGPSFVDWSRFKGDIAGRIEAATGRRLAIDGKIAVAILPTPQLAVGGLRLANLPGAATPDMVRLKALEIRIAFAPLLAGRVRVESLALVEPQVSLERLPDGRNNWTFVSEAPAVAPPQPAGPAAPERPAEGVPAWFQLDHMTIENGTVTYRDGRTAQSVTVDQVNAGITAATARGPFRAQGRATMQGVPLSLEASLQRIGTDKPAGFGLKLALTGAQLDLTGTLAHQEAGIALAGKLRLSSIDLRATLATLARVDAGALPPVLAQSLAVDGTLAGSAAKFAATGLTIRLGDTDATGSFRFEPASPSRAALKLAANRIDLDKWRAIKAPPSATPPAGPAPPSEAGGSTGRGPTPESEPASELASFSLPGDLEASVEATVEALVYRGGVIRQVRFAAGLSKGELALNQLTAALPGSSDVTFYGALRTADGQPSFTGNVEAASDNLRGLLDWLGVNTSRIPAERLRKLSLASAIQLNPRQLQLRDVDLNLDVTHLVGGATILLQDRPAFGASVAIDRLNLDAYLPEPGRASAGAAPASSASAGAGTGSAAAAQEPFQLLEGFDANVRARVDELTLRGTSIRGVRLDGTVQAGALTLREARVDDLAGIKGGMTGSLSGLTGQPALDLAVDLNASELATFLRFAAVKSPVPAEQLGAASLKGHVKGGLEQLALALDGTLGGGTYKLDGTLGLLAAGPSYDLDIAIKAPRLEPLLRPIASDVSLAGVGGIDLDAHVKGDTRGLVISGLKAHSGLLDLAGNLVIEGYPQKPSVKADLSGASRRLGLLAALLGARLPATLDRLGAIQLRLKADGDANGTALDSELSASGATLALSGKLGPVAAGPSYALALQANHGDLAALLRQLAPGYRPAGEKLGALSLQAVLKGGADQLTLGNLEAKLGPVTLTGTIGAVLTGTRPKFTAKLAANAIDLDPFLPAQPEAKRGAKLRVRGQAAMGANSRWSTAPLELAALGSADGDLALTAPSLSYGSYKLEDAALNATLAQGVLDLSGLSGKLYGGPFKLSGRLDAQALPKLALGLRLDGANPGDAGLKIGQVRLARGTLSMAADLAASGNSELALVQGLDGTGSFKMRDGVIDGLDLDAVNQRLAALTRPVDMIRLVQAAASGGESTVKSLDGGFTVRDGVAETKDLKLEAEGATGKGEATVDLPRWYMEAEVAFKLTGAADAPPFSLKFKGAPDAPRKFLNAKELQAYLLRRGLSNAVKGGKKGAAAPGSGAAHDAAPPTQQQQAPAPPAPSPQSIIQDLLKSLQKKAP